MIISFTTRRMFRYARLFSKSTFMARLPPQNPLLVVLGATGTGKSQVTSRYQVRGSSNLVLTVFLQLAVELALRFNGEIINGDAMQMYQGLPIVTNKITPAEQQGIPHHLLSFIPLHEEPWRVTKFKRHTSQVIKEIRSRGKLPILVGGTHYYTQSLMFQGSSIEWSSEDEEQELSREEIYRRFPILKAESEVMYEKLKEVDPVMAARWHPKDKRKIERSLEIFLLSGRKASDVYAEQKRRRGEAMDVGDSEVEVATDVPLSSTLLFWVHSDKEVLNERLDARIGKMITNGLEAEVLSMNNYLQEHIDSENPVDKTRGIWISIGWKEFEEYLQALKSGTVSEEDLRKLRSSAIEKTQIATRQYARRQIQWIRHKLIPALAQENASDKLYLVDSTNVSKWTENVHEPAISIADAFLRGLEKPCPADLSANAQLHLAIHEPAALESLMQKECEICGTILAGEKQWEAHLKSRKHRSVLKNQGKKAAQAKYLQERKALEDSNHDS